ncbi:PepSY-associated TM helix domain-containing protein [Sphingosinicella sp.]|uniref:PepSY-associated TM helix domain-containing protein n=1 Tax=Sphingosinicella sp. TaxID=1917971 RepID=UPI0035B09921
MTPGTRTTLLKLHRWVGLAFAALLLVQGLTGTLLVFRAEIDGIIHPALVVTPGEALPVQTLVDTVREASPEATLQRIRFSEDPTRAAIFVMRANDAPWMVAVDPYSGGIVRAGSYAAWPTEWLFHLHDTLLAGKTGEIIVTIEGVALIFLAVFGIIIWWPGRRRLKSGFRILTGQGADRTVRTAHRAIGAAIGIVLVMSGVTGALLIHRAALQPYLPVVPRPKFEVALSQAPLRPVDTLLADARARHGPLPLREVRFSGAAGQVVALYFQDETSRRPNATRQYFYNAYEGIELGRYEPAALPPMNTAYDWLFTIHTGKAGGLVGRLVVLAAGLSLVFFAGSGVWLWFSARRQQRARRAKAENRLVRNAA